MYKIRSKRKLYDKQKRIMMCFSHSSQRWLDCIKISTTNSLTHEITKLKKCYDIKKKGHHFLTEAMFKGIGKGRCDVVDLNEGVIYEVLETESLEDAKEKAARYPLPVEYVHS